MARQSVTLAVLAVCAAAAASSAAESQARDLTMTLAWIADSGRAQPKEFLFVLNGVVAFRTLEGLKKYVRDLPSGSKLTWPPGCCRIGSEPLLSSPKDLEAFRAFCGSCGVRCVLVPSG